MEDKSVATKKKTSNNELDFLSKLLLTTIMLTLTACVIAGGLKFIIWTLS